MDFFKFKKESDYQEFLKYLYSISKSECVQDLERHRAIINTTREIIGISMAEIRSIAKIIAKFNPYNFLEFSKGESYEEVMIQGLVISNIKDIDKQISYLDEWKEKIDSWSLCDSVVSNMKWLKNEKYKKDYFDYFYNLCYQEKEFVSRLGIIILMTYYLQEEYIDKIYQMCESVTNDAYYVQMGIAWLISVGYVNFKQKTYELLEKQKLCKFIQNKAISKCRESFRVDINDKEILKTLKIK